MIEKPMLRGHFHQAMFFISLGACLLLLIQTQSHKEFLSIMVYSTGVLALFGISALYHRIHWEPRPRLWMKRLDHAGIYIMIAGCMTPIAQIVLPEASGTKLLLIAWIVAAIGILQSLFFVNLPKIISASLYLIMGFLILPYLSELIPLMGKFNLLLLLTGGGAYAVGALAYGLKRPVFNPRVFGYHEFFHLMVCVGALFHFIMIYRIVNW